MGDILDVLFEDLERTVVIFSGVRCSCVSCHSRTFLSLREVHKCCERQRTDEAFIAKEVLSSFLLNKTIVLRERERERVGAVDVRLCITLYSHHS